MGLWQGQVQGRRCQVEKGTRVFRLSLSFPFLVWTCAVLGIFKKRIDGGFFFLYNEHGA